VHLIDGVEDLPAVVDGWINWEATHLAP
jgi:hypothetical protein